MSELTPFQAKVYKVMGDDELSPYQVALRLAPPFPTTGRFLWLRRFVWMPDGMKAMRALWNLERLGLVTNRRDPGEPDRRLYRRVPQP